MEGVDTALAALGGATLAEEDDGDFDAGLTTGFAAALTADLATGFITDLATIFLFSTFFATNLLTGAVFLTAKGFAFVGATIFLAVVLTTDLTTGFVDVLIGFLAAGFTAVLVATFTGVLLFLAGVFTSCLLWAVACG